MSTAAARFRRLLAVLPRFAEQYQVVIQPFTRVESIDPQARRLVPAMLNNSAWDLHELGRPAEALPLFEQALS